MRAYSRQQKANMESMVAAVHRMERKLYKNSIPEQVDYDDLLQMSSTGLRDGLTGVVTRTGIPKQDAEAAGEWRIRELYDTLLC